MPFPPPPLPLFLALALVAVFPASASAAVYVTAADEGAVTTFDRGPQGGSGALAAAGPSVPTGAEPAGVAVSPDGEHVYVANGGSDSVSAYAAGAGGQLTPLTGPVAETGPEPGGIAVSPDGRLLFTADDGGSVSSFVLGAGGTPDPAPGSPRAVGGTPSALAVSPDGRSLYVTDADDGSLRAFSISADGSIAPLGAGSVPAGIAPAAIAIEPDGSHLFVANEGSGTVSVFTPAADGTPGPAVSYAAGGAAPAALSPTPDGNRLLVGLRGEDRVSVLSISSAGALSPVAGSPFATVSMPAALAVAPDGRHAYATAGDGPAIGGHAIAASGTLSPIAGSPFSDGAAAHERGSIAITPEQAPQAAFAYSQPTRADLLTEFDASDSTDPDGAIASYAWSFGDGTTAVGAEASHSYPRPGRYTATLRVIDGAGCGAELVFAGQTAFCNGGPSAIATAEVIVPEPAVLNPYVEAAKTQRLGGKVGVRLKAGAGEPVEIEAGGKILIDGAKGKIRLAAGRVSVEGGDREVVKLRPKKRKDKGRVLRLLDRGAGLRAKVSVRFTDVPGNTALERAKVRLEPKR